MIIPLDGWSQPVLPIRYETVKQRPDGQDGNAQATTRGTCRLFIPFPLFIQAARDLQASRSSPPCSVLAYQIFTGASLSFFFGLFFLRPRTPFSMLLLIGAASSSTKDLTYLQVPTDTRHPGLSQVQPPCLPCLSSVSRPTACLRNTSLNTHRIRNLLLQEYSLPLTRFSPVAPVCCQFFF
ncbi:hypothetical protein F4780DRAFT_406672 [Xylariomycetidae sp. FL0641]|nr:hypothetical protein F4780DRAFT_406672 [Xylariomycetidae sp. FL0641]